jgi:hypothetical protein
MVLAGAGAAWSAAAIDSLVETILTPGPAIRMFGRSIAFTGPRTETIVLTLLGLSVGAILAVTATWVGQTLGASTRRKELERRSEQRALVETGLVAKNDLLTWRVDDLQARRTTCWPNAMGSWTSCRPSRQGRRSSAPRPGEAGRPWNASQRSSW